MIGTRPTSASTGSRKHDWWWWWRWWRTRGCADTWIPSHTHALTLTLWWTGAGSIPLSQMWSYWWMQMSSYLERSNAFQPRLWKSLPAVEMRNAAWSVSGAALQLQIPSDYSASQLPPESGLQQEHIKCMQPPRTMTAELHALHSRTMSGNVWHSEVWSPPATFSYLTVSLLHKLFLQELLQQIRHLKLFLQKTEKCKRILH